MLRPELIHPMIVHFPIVLIIVALGAFAAFAATKNEFFSRVGAWAITLGALSAAATVGAGLLAEANAAHSEAAHEILENFHEPLGLTVLGLSAFLAAWGFASKWRLSGRKLAAYLVILSATVAVLAFTAHYGAMMVYEQGMGVNPEVLNVSTHHNHDMEGDHEHGDHHDEMDEDGEHHHDEMHEDGEQTHDMHDMMDADHHEMHEDSDTDMEGEPTP